jgi:hypothetical protein
LVCANDPVGQLVATALKVDVVQLEDVRG